MNIKVNYLDVSKLQIDTAIQFSFTRKKSQSDNGSLLLRIPYIVLIEFVSETHDFQELSDSSWKQFHQTQFLNEFSSCEWSSSVICCARLSFNYEVMISI